MENPGFVKNIFIKPCVKEKDFVTQYHKWLRSLWHIVHKISDAGIWYKFFDAVWFSPDGRQFTNEYKVVDGLTFNISKFEESQKFLLHEISKKWWSVNVIVYSKKLNTYTNLSYDFIMKNKNESWWVKIFELPEKTH